MKFEQALKAMRRGEVVKRKDPSISAIRFWIEDGKVMQKGPYDNWPRESTDYQFSMKSCADINDWVIVRKKPKAPAPCFTEDQLEPVGTMPVVGDTVFMPQHAATHYTRGEFIPAEETLELRDGYWYTKNGRGPWRHEDLMAYRILRRPAKPLRDVFADPRVGDVIETKSGSDQYTVVGVDDRSVTFACGAVGKQSREQWAAPRNAYNVISRAPEVAPK